MDPSRSSAFRLNAAWTRTLLLLRRLGRSRTLSVVVFAVLGFGGSLAVGLVRGAPLPFVHDEFSYLLAGDTFASGRLTNPTHPLWEHFESFHIIHQPTYQSKYPPGQGLVLGLGQALTGEPAVGVWISAGLMAAAVGWALLVWLPPAWGTLVSLMFIAHLAWFSYWAQSFWGGNVAAIGGALAFGGFRALIDRPRWSYGAAFGTGLAVMAASRPLEGVIVALFLGGALLLQAVKARGAGARGLILRGGVGAAAVLLVALAALGHYNREVTGSPFTMPYQVHEAEYAAAPTLLVQAPGPPPSYRHAEIERYWLTWGRDRHERLRSFPTVLRHVWDRLVAHSRTLLGVAALGILGLFGVVHGLDLSRASHRKGFTLAISAMLMVVVASSATKAAHSHYIAPITVVLWIAVGGGLLGFHRRARRRRDFNLAPLILLVSVLATFLTGLGIVLSPPGSFALERAQMIESLEDLPGDHLVLVTYRDGYNFFEEWVYNRADIDGASVVWARSMGSVRDRALLDYFENRTPWHLEVGREVQLRPLDRDRAYSDALPRPVSPEP